ncbi:MAG TPA: hypothetical protein VMW89_21105 [Desulfatiglandales bacterium]|nr:hypothetical protein [Desulfatiglandales bacterium]
MMRRICIICLVVLLGASGKLVFADGKPNTGTTISESIVEILNSINEIIRSSIAIAEAELKELQWELRKKGDSLEKQAGESIVQTLHKTLAELKKLEEALKKNLAEMEGLSRDNYNKYRKKREHLEMRVERFKERLKALAEETEKRRESLNEQVREKALDIVEEMKRTLNRMEERVKRQRQVENMLST